MRHHCHYTGQYRGAAHNRCNLNHRIPSHIPVIFHNLSKYDAHLFIRELASSYYTNERYGVDEMEVLAENSEKYISFSVPIRVGLRGEDGKPLMKKNAKGEEVCVTKTCKLRFIDSMRFMQSSLSDLVDNLAETNTDGLKCCVDGSFELLEINASYKARYECGKCGIILEKQLNKESLEKRFANLRKRCGCDEHFRLFLRKGVYPYEYMDSFERFDEAQLPPKKAFYSELNLSNISKNDYAYANGCLKPLNVEI